MRTSDGSRLRVKHFLCGSLGRVLVPFCYAIIPHLMEQCIGTAIGGVVPVCIIVVQYIIIPLFALNSKSYAHIFQQQMTTITHIHTFQQCFLCYSSIYSTEVPEMKN